MTAVQWLLEQLTEVERKNWINNKILPISKNSLAKKTLDVIFQQALEMEKQQIIDAIVDAWNDGFSSGMYQEKKAEQYYNETFKQK